MSLVGGKLVINEESVVQNVPVQTKLYGGVVNDSQRIVNSGSFRSRPANAKKWSVEETRLFYKALRMFGSNFLNISFIVKTRSRQQIRNKFKKEEYQNPHLIEYALKNRLVASFSLPFSLFLPLLLSNLSFFFSFLSAEEEINQMIEEDPRTNGTVATAASTAQSCDELLNKLKKPEPTSSDSTDSPSPDVEILPAHPPSDATQSPNAKSKFPSPSPSPSSSAPVPAPVPVSVPSESGEETSNSMDTSEGTSLEVESVPFIPPPIHVAPPAPKPTGAPVFKPRIQLKSRTTPSPAAPPPPNPPTPPPSPPHPSSTLDNPPHTPSDSEIEYHSLYSPSPLSPSTPTPFSSAPSTPTPTTPTPFSSAPSTPTPFSSAPSTPTPTTPTPTTPTPTTPTPSTPTPAAATPPQEKSKASKTGNKSVTSGKGKTGSKKLSESGSKEAIETNSPKNTAKKSPGTGKKATESNDTPKTARKTALAAKKSGKAPQTVKNVKVSPKKTVLYPPSPLPDSNTIITPKPSKKPPQISKKAKKAAAESINPRSPTTSKYSSQTSKKYNSSFPTPDSPASPASSPLSFPVPDSPTLKNSTKQSLLARSTDSQTSDPSAPPIPPDSQSTASESPINNVTEKEAETQSLLTSLPKPKPNVARKAAVRSIPPKKSKSPALPKAQKESPRTEPPQKEPFESEPTEKIYVQSDDYSSSQSGNEAKVLNTFEDFELDFGDSSSQSYADGFSFDSECQTQAYAHGMESLLSNFEDTGPDELFVDTQSYAAFSEGSSSDMEADD